MAKKKTTCGDFGGKKRDGKPCQRKAGWGTGKHVGPCKDHGETAHEKEKALKIAFLEAIEDPYKDKGQAAIAVGSSVPTIWRLRQEDPEFDKAVCQIHLDADRKRVEAVEDSLFCRIVAGNASAAETLFYLMNRAPDRWQDKRNVQHSVDKDAEKTLARLLGVDVKELPE